MIKLYIWYICSIFWNSSFQFVHTYSWYSDLSSVLTVILPEPDASFSLGSRWAWEIMPENQFVAPHKNTCTWCTGVWLSINTHMAEPWMDACAIWKSVFHKYVHCFVGCVLPYLIVVIILPENSYWCMWYIDHHCQGCCPSLEQCLPRTTVGDHNKVWIVYIIPGM